MSNQSERVRAWLARRAAEYEAEAERLQRLAESYRRLRGMLADETNSLGFSKSSHDTSVRT
jgi:hypothetical protein